MKVSIAVTYCSQEHLFLPRFGKQYRRVLLPLLILLVVCKSLVVLGLAHRDPGNLREQERHECWTDAYDGQGCKLTTPT